MKKRYFLILPLVFASIAFTQEEKVEKEKPQYDQGYGVGQDVMAGGYNTSARIDVKGAWDYYITGSFIYWQPKMYLPYGYGYIGDGLGADYTDSNQLKQKTYLVDFDYHPGFKVGLGTNTDMDDWNLFFEYTRLTTKDSSSTRIPEPLTDYRRLISYFDIPTGPDGGSFQPSFARIGYIRASSKFYINLLDMELGRPCYVGTKLTFKPYVGVRGGWLEQENNIKIKSWNTAETDYAYVYLKEESDTWLLGPRVGLDTNWHLGEGFRLFGNVAASLFYQHYKIYVKQYLPIQTNDTVSITTERSNKEKLKDYLFNPCLEAVLGFGWGTYFSDHEWHVDLFAGYEIQYFFNQYYIGQILDTLNYKYVDNTMSDLTLQGLTVNLRFDF